MEAIQLLLHMIDSAKILSKNDFLTFWLILTLVGTQIDFLDGFSLENDIDICDK
jgi:hypothetical protein